MEVSIDLESKGMGLLLLGHISEDGTNKKKHPRPVARRSATMACLVLVALVVLFSLTRGTMPCHQPQQLKAAETWSDHRVDDISPTRPIGLSAIADRTAPFRRQTTTPANKTVLECFQVHQPVLTPQGATTDDSTGGAVALGSGSNSSSTGSSCTVLLMDYVFAYSYGTPFIADYTPPDCDFNRVVINFTAVSQGRQFDRLALMYFGDTEVWRTSTAEPTTAPGIRWVYLKDMTEYLSLWKSPQKLIFDLGNLVDSTYTGTFNTTLTATFFTEQVDTDVAPPSDLIIPISKRQGAEDAVSDFILPQDNATNTITFPQNANRAIFSVSANGQANEEFWWSNVLQSDANTFAPTAGAFPGYSPWREVQVLIDGQLAGVQWPFPVIFTGGVVPSLHRPIVGIDAFDLREHEIDITAWLPVLCDGAEHTFSIEVVGLDDDGASSAYVTDPVGASWYVTGKIFVWLDEEGSITTGDAPTIEASAPTITVSQSITQNATGSNETLTYDTEVSRTFKVTGNVVSQNSSGATVWTQSLTYSNKGYVTGFGYNQINDFLITGADESTGLLPYKTEYKYPLYCDSNYGVSDTGNITLTAQLVQGLQLYVEGAAVFPTGLDAYASTGVKYSGSLLTTTKNGSASYFAYGDNSFSTGFGSSDQVFTFSGFEGAGSVDASPDAELYYRHAAYVNGSITTDTQVVSGADTGGSDVGGSSGGFKNQYAEAPLNGATSGPRAFMNRQDAIVEL